MKSYITEDFAGIVYLKDWIRGIDGKQYMAIAGQVSIVEDKDLIGFKTRGTESNWVANIKSVLDSRSVLTVLGCQIRAIGSNIVLPDCPVDVLVLE